MLFNEYTLSRDLIENKDQIEQIAQMIENKESTEVILEFLGKFWDSMTGKNRRGMAPISAAAKHRGEYDGSYSGSPQPNFNSPRYMQTQGGLPKTDTASKYDRNLGDKETFLDNLKKLLYDTQKAMAAVKSLTTTNVGLFRKGSQFPDNVEKVSNWLDKVIQAIGSEWAKSFNQGDKPNYAGVNPGYEQIDKAPHINQPRKYF